MSEVNSKRLTILSKTKIDDLYGLPQFNEDERAFYFSLDEEEIQEMESLRSLDSRVHFILQLGYFKTKTLFFETTFLECKEDVQYISNRYFGGVEITKNSLSQRTIFNNYSRILKCVSYTFMNKNMSKKLSQKSLELARICVDPCYIFDHLILFLEEQHIVLPGYSTLQDMIGKSLTLETQRLHSLIQQHMPESIDATLKKLLVSGDEGKQNKEEEREKEFKKIYGITLLKKDAKGFNYKEMMKEVNKKQTSEVLFHAAKKIIPHLEISPQNVSYYASLIDYYSVDRLNELSYETARLYLLCYIFYRFEKIHDNLVNIFFYRMGIHETQAKKHAKDVVCDHKRETSDYDETIATILDLFLDKKIKNSKIRPAAFKIVKEESFSVLPQHLRNQLIDELKFRWDYYLTIAKTIAKNTRPLVCAIDFESDTPKSPLMEAIRFIKNTFAQHQSLKQQKVDKFPLDFIPADLQSYIYEAQEVDGKIQKVLNVYQYEFLVYYCLKKALDSELIFVNTSYSFKSLKEDLYQDWDTNKDSILKKLNNPVLNQPIKERLKELREEYNKRLLEVNEHIKSGENKSVHIKKESIVIKDDGEPEKIVEWTLPYPKKEEEINDPFYEQFAHIGLSQVLHEVNKHCSLMDEFTHIKSRYSKTKADKDSIFATITALATGYGIFYMSDICDIGYTRLLSTFKNFIRLENLKKANAKVVNKLATLLIFKHWNLLDNQLISSLDGKKALTRQNHFMARHSKKYFGQKRGVVLYSMIANNACPNAMVISPNDYEGHSYFDVAFNQITDIHPDFFCGDTHSINQVNFPLVELMGASFIPHIKNIPEQTKKIGCFEDPETYKNKDYLIVPEFQYDENLIEEEWDNMRHIYVSLLMKTTTQRVIIRKLCSGRRSRTQKALAEYNKILHDLHVLNVIDNPQLRRATRTSLNRGEGYHQLTGKIISINGSKLRGATEVELIISSECIRLIANCIIFYNAYMLSELYEMHEKLGNTKILEILKKISPIAWRHINLNGRYEFSTIFEALNLMDILSKIVFDYKK
jgi:TnpA family transposase